MEETNANSVEYVKIMRYNHVRTLVTGVIINEMVVRIQTKRAAEST